MYSLGGVLSVLYILQVKRFLFFLIFHLPTVCFFQGYFTAAKNFRKAAPELWTAFGIACCKGVSATWVQRAAEIRATWRQDGMENH